jgi:hypothetical protein
MKKLVTMACGFAMVLALVAAAAGCIEAASDAQVEAACRNLEKINAGQAGDEAARLAKCKADLGRERLSAAKADCRTKAADVDTFWNKCR